MAIDFNTLKDALGFLLSGFGAASAVVIWYRGSVKKAYAAERDFNHLKRNQENHAKALTMVDNEVKELRDAINDRFHRQETELVQIKALLMSAIARTGGENSVPFR
ncbi:MAG: hypothetical protein F6K28_46760 [Microcoleus sp. SIO2G3]|nr:hypothetical protein [Microcoleus sp. SIO2G3]